MKELSRANWLESETICDCGLVRTENQDAYFSCPEDGIFVVADGMGGGQGGARASALVAESFRAAARGGDLAERLERTTRAIAEANANIAAYALSAGYRQMGSTVAVLLLGDTLPGEALAVWIGDSRIYRIRAGAVSALTSDHTVANELFGRMACGGEGYSRNLPYAHVLTRALGVDPRVSSDARRFEARPGDRFLICSDGVHDMLAEDRIGELIASAETPRAGVESLAAAVRAAGALDNFTATLVFLKGGAA